MRTVADYRTTLTPDGNGFRINGTKFYSTGALFAQWIPIVAKASGAHCMWRLRATDAGLVRGG